MLKILDRAYAGLSAIHKLLEWGAVLCVLAISALIFGNVLLRNLFSIGLTWVDELARFLHVTLVFLAVPVLFSEQCHIRLDAVVERVHPNIRRPLRLLSLIATVAFAFLFLKSDWQFMERHGDVPSPAMLMPNYLFFGGLVVGVALLFVDAALDLLGAIVGHKRQDCEE